MTRLLFLLPLLVGRISFSQIISDSSFGRPILLYTVYDPWAMFMGADGPILRPSLNLEKLFSGKTGNIESLNSLRRKK